MLSPTRVKSRASRAPQKLLTLARLALRNATLLLPYLAAFHVSSAERALKAGQALRNTVGCGGSRLRAPMQQATCFLTAESQVFGPQGGNGHFSGVAPFLADFDTPPQHRTHGQARRIASPMKLLRKAKLGTTLWAAFGLLLALSVTQGVLVATRVAEVERISQGAVEGVTALAADLRTIETDAQQAATTVAELSGKMQEEVAGSMTEGRAEMRLLQRNVEGCVADAGAIVEGLQDLIDSGELDDDTAGMLEDLLFDAEDSADRIRKEALPIVRAGVQRLEEAAAATHQAAAEVAAVSDTMSGFSKSSKQSNEMAAGVASDIQRSLSTASGTRIATLVAAGIVVVIGAGVPLVLVPRISNEVRRTVATMERVAGGELDQRIESKAFDEFSRVASAINRAVASMASAVQSIRAGSTQLASSSHSLADTADTLSDGADRTTKLSVSVASASEEMSISMGQVASSVEELSDGNREISEATDEMLTNIRAVSDSVERAAGVAGEAATLIDSGSDRIGRLGDAAGEISDVSNVIQDIAEMTNLLALNAAIEAARAGDAGKGFAVVATEVRELARQTSEATDSIRQRIDAIQNASNEAVDLVQSIDAVVRQVRSESDSISENVRSQTDTTQRIAEKISAAATAAGVVATNISQTAEASREIATSIAEVDAAARMTAEAAVATRNSGGELTSLSQELDKTLAAFTD